MHINIHNPLVWVCLLDTDVSVLGMNDSDYWRNDVCAEFEGQCWLEMGAPVLHPKLRGLPLVFHLCISDISPRLYTFK